MRIGSELLAALNGEAAAAAPRECCGLLWTVSGDRAESYTAYPGPLHPRRFELDDEWLLAQYYRARRGGSRLLGFYHSHPSGGPLYPSSTDLFGHPPGSLCLLLGIEAGQARCFRLDRRTETVEEVKVETELSPLSKGFP